MIFKKFMVVFKSRGIMNRKFIVSILVLSFVQYGTFAATLDPKVMVPQAGSINRHDLDMLKNYAQEKRLEQDCP